MDSMRVDIYDALSTWAVLQGQRRAQHGLHEADWSRLRDLQASLAHHLGEKWLRCEKREHLRLFLQTPLVVEGRSGQLLLRNVSRSGAFVESADVSDERIWLEAVHIEDARIPLQVDANVVWHSKLSNHEKASLTETRHRVGLQFVVPDDETQNRIDRVFDVLLERLASGGGRYRALADGQQLMFGDAHQLWRVCNLLLRKADLGGVWTPRGPTNQAIHYLRENGGSLQPNERALLLLVWDLWIGAVDVRGTHLWYMDSATQDAVLELLMAIRHSSLNIEDWLEKHSW